MSLYAHMIKEIVPNHDPRHVEAYMRLENSTLDGLSPVEFRNEVWIAAECVDMEGAEIAERLAKSYGL